MATHQQEQLQQQQSSAMDTGPPNPLDTDGLCLLSIDGGGVRGLASLYILKSVMDRLNTARRNSEMNSPRLKPCDVFDLIGGTSTGGYDFFFPSTSLLYSYVCASHVVLFLFTEVLCLFIPIFYHP